MKHGKTRVNFDMGDEDYSRLSLLAERNGTTRAGIVRQAIRLFEVASEEQTNGHRLAVVNRDGLVVVRLAVI
jgi:predicted DNA-binding protein